MNRDTQLKIVEDEVDVRYGIHSGVVEWMMIKFPCGHFFDMSELLDITSVREALEDHHANLLEEDNCES